MGFGATVDDLQARFRTLGTEEKKQAELLIEDASAMLSAELKRANVTPEDALVRAVLYKMVQRVLVARDVGGLGVTQYSQGASPYSASVTFANPMGDLYLTKQEKRLLGIGSTRMFSIQPKIEVKNDQPL